VGGWSTPRSGCFTSGKDPVALFIGDWLGHRTSVNVQGKFSHTSWFKPRTVKPVASGCNDYAIPAHRTAEQKLKFKEIINTNIMYTYLKTSRQIAGVWAEI